MSVMVNILLAIKLAVNNSAALSAFHSAKYAVGLPPADAFPAITMDGVFSPESKQAQLQANIHLWFKPAQANKMGDIYELAEAFKTALLSTELVQPGIWLHRPEPNNAVDHVVFPVTIHVAALNA
ncbi:MAG: hypothetical protein K2X80_04055 [Pseudomonadaceae bacterium]|nr:hypothetical protein [Pseudomonadaceae bacterium]